MAIIIPELSIIKTKPFSGWTKVRSIGKLQIYYALSAFLMTCFLSVTIQGVKFIEENQKSVQYWGLDVGPTSVMVVKITCTMFAVPLFIIEVLLHLLATLQLLVINWCAMDFKRILKFGGFAYAWRFVVCATSALVFATAFVFLEDTKLFVAALSVVFAYRFSFLEMRNYNREIAAICTPYNKIC